MVIKFDAAGNVYVGTRYILFKCDPQGNRLWAVPTGTARLANIELSADGRDIYVAGTGPDAGSERFLTARFRQTDDSSLPVLSAPLASQALPPGGVMNLSATAIAPDPVTYQWLRWGRFYANGSSLMRTNPLAAEYSLQMTTSAGATVSPWARVSYAPVLTNVTVFDDGQIAFSIDGEVNAYTIEASTNLMDWTAVTNIFVCSSGMISNVVVPNGWRFFRVSRDY